MSPARQSCNARSSIRPHGCVGLAVTLARACAAGRVLDVVSGEALLTDLAGWYERTLGSESRHVLGVLALSGDSGATLEQVREFLGLSLPQTSDLVGGLASGGTIDEVPHCARRLQVQPEALRYELVRDVFFSGPGSPDVARAIEYLDPSSSAAIPAPRRGTPRCGGRPQTAALDCGLARSKNCRGIRVSRPG